MRTDLEVILTKVRSNHGNLPKSRYTGWLWARPSVGQRLEMETREDGTLVTTPITTVRFTNEHEVEFDTNNSTYKVQYLKPADEASEMHITPLESELLSVFSSNGIHDSSAIIDHLYNLEGKLLGLRRG